MILHLLLLILHILILAVLACMSFLYRGAVNFSTFSEHILIVPQNALLICAGAAAAAALSCLLSKTLSGKEERSARRLSASVSALCFVLAFAGALLWSRINPYPPAADQFTLWDAAGLIADGEPFDLYAPYVRSYPYQKGMILFMTFLREHAGSRALSLFHALNALCGALLVPLCGKLARILSGRKDASAAACVLALLFLPLLFYAPFLYGTLPSLALNFSGFIAVLQVCEAMKKTSGGSAVRAAVWALSAAVCFALSVQLYTASLIAVTAALLTLLYSAAESLRALWDDSAARGRILLLSLAACALLVILPVPLQRGVDSAFRLRTGVEDTGGIPASAYLYMGISSEDGAAGPGSHNGRDIGLFSENEMDTRRTDLAARGAIREVIGEYASGERSLRFFADKTLWQWADPWFSSIVLTVHPRGISVAWPPAFSFVMESGLLPAIEIFLGILLPLVYAAALAGCLFIARDTVRRAQKNRGAGSASVLLSLYFTGGFVFQFFWEAKARYCLPYFTALLPLAACGIARACAWLMSRRILLCRTFRSQRPSA